MTGCSRLLQRWMRFVITCSSTHKDAVHGTGATTACGRYHKLSTCCPHGRACGKVRGTLFTGYCSCAMLSAQIHRCLWQCHRGLPLQPQWLARWNCSADISKWPPPGNYAAPRALLHDMAKSLVRSELISLIHVGARSCSGHDSARHTQPSCSRGKEHDINKPDQPHDTPFPHTRLTRCLTSRFWVPSGTYWQMQQCPPSHLVPVWLILFASPHQMERRRNNSIGANFGRCTSHPHPAQHLALCHIRLTSPLQRRY